MEKIEQKWHVGWFISQPTGHFLSANLLLFNCFETVSVIKMPRFFELKLLEAVRPTGH